MQCGNSQALDPEERFSCNSAICLECSLKYYQLVADSETPVEQCNMCGHSLVIHTKNQHNQTIDASKIQLQSTIDLAATADLTAPEGDAQLYAPSQGLESNFSNIEELEAEHLESSVENT